jgi:4-amino-4-deoxy-L-arabinose transferase-like glycosyltransferase
MSGSINEAEGPRPQRDPSAFRRWGAWLAPLLTAFVACMSIVVTLDGAGETAPAIDAPGVTLDEIFNVQSGSYLWQSLVLEGPSYFTLAGAERVFNQPLANPDHPPLGRILIGMTHDLVRYSREWHASAQAYSITSARVGSALMFVCTVFLVGAMTANWFGSWAGGIAAGALVVMPRPYGHAHLASLETGIGLLFSAAVLYVADRWTRTLVLTDFRRSNAATRSAQTESLMLAASATLPRWGHVVIAGVVLGLALLTKIQAILLPIPIALWALWLWRWRAIPRLLMFGSVGVVVFFLGWPWLWLDPVGHTLQYLGRTTDRPTLYCYYLGERYADVAVPWHYPFVMFLTTVPVGLLALGFCGTGCCRWLQRPWRTLPVSAANAGSIGYDPRTLLVGGVVLFVLTFFALPGITNYDGERLFLVVYPLSAVLVGRGVQYLWVAADGVMREGGIGRLRVMAAVLLAAGIGEGLWGLVQLHPCHLSYYNLAVGSLGGADRLGFEPTYWRDSFTRQFLSDVVASVPARSTLYIAPVLHPANRIDLPLLSPLLSEHGLHTDSYDDKDTAKRNMRYVLVFRRHADPWDSLEPAPTGAKLLCEVRRSGVQLAALYDLRGE